MVMTSSQIAQANGGYQAQYMQNQQQASMMSGRGPSYGGAYSGNSQSFGEAAFGGGMNAAASMAPIGRAGLGIVGADPMGVGMAAGIGAGGIASAAGIGMAGSAAIGLGVGAAAALPVAGLYAGASYMGGQVMGGMQQQQQFNMQMRGAYGHRPNQFGGSGFTAGEMGGMGNMMRDMSTQQGSMGQMVGFEELGRLAANMGRMGMDQGVRDAKEFKDKLKQMVATLKSVAEDMGTSLEEAQKMMQGMRSAGIFGAGKQAAVSGMVRKSALAGGVSTSEVTGMMGIGSQVSRMIGGRGQAGAMAGMHAITNIGISQQMGILSEEDIYNVTGQTGAAGRAALATKQLQSSAKFLKSSLGRRIIASMAGEDGTLNQESVNAYMAGGVGTGGTMGMAGRNLSKVGRANFVRNEGRLRGEVMGQFGGLMPAIAMKGWLGQRGMDPNSDRAMLFAQRRLGMGRDEADALMKQVDALPRIMEERRYSAENDELKRDAAAHGAQSGIKGIKNKMRQAEATISGALQQYGADMMSSISDRIDRIVNRATGSLVSVSEKDVMRKYDQGMRGDAETLRGYFGVGGGMVGSKAAYDSWEQGFSQHYRGGGVGGLAGTVGKYFKGLGDKADVQRGEGRTLMRGLLQGAEGVGLGKLGGIATSFGKENKEDILMAQAFGALGGDTAGERLDSFGRFLSDRSGTRKGKTLGWSRLSSEYEGADAEQKARIEGRVLGGAGRLKGEVGVANALGAGTNLMGLSKGIFGTVEERHEAMGASLMTSAGIDAKDVFRDRTTKGADEQMESWGLGFLKDIPGAGLMRRMGMTAARSVLGKGAMLDPTKGAASMGRFLDSTKGRDLGIGIMSTEAGVRGAARTGNLKAMATLRQSISAGGLKGEGLLEATAELQVRGTADMASRVGTLFKDTGGGEGFESGVQELVDKYNAKRPEGAKELTRENLLGAASALGGLQQHKTKERVRQAALQAKSRANKSFDTAGRLYGMVERTEEGGFRLTGMSEKDKKAMGIGGKGYLTLMMQATEMERDLSGLEGDEAATQRKLADIAGVKESARGELWAAPTKELEATAKNLRAAGSHGQADFVERTGKVKKTLMGAGRGTTSAVAGLLGGKLSGSKWGPAKMQTIGQSAKDMLKSMGMSASDIGDEGMEQLKKTLGKASAMGSLTGKERERATQDMMGDLSKTQDVLNKGQGKKQLEQEKADNILMGQMAESLGEIKTFTSKTVGSIDALPTSIASAIEKIKS